MTMKNITSITTAILLCISLSSSLFAQKGKPANTKSTIQIDRTKAPEPAKAPAINIGKYDKFELDNGLRVIVVQHTKLPRVSFQLTVDFLPPLENQAVGTAKLAAELMKTGTTTRTKGQIDEAIDFIGADFSTQTDGFYASSLSRHTEKLLEIVADVFFNPSYSQTELDKIKKKAISGLAAQKSDANAISGNVGAVLRNGKSHPYAEIATEETYEAVTTEMCRAYIEKHFKPNAAYLVIVGDITPDYAKKLAEKYFGAWKKGSIPSYTYTQPALPNGNTVAFSDKPGAVQSLISITFPLEYNLKQEDYIAASIMNSILGGGGFSARLFQNIRESKGYTYGAYSRLNPDVLTASFSAGASVRNSVTDSAITEFLYEIRRIRENLVTDEELQLTKNFVTGNFARTLEQPQTIARFALNIERFKLPADFYQTYLEKVNAITKEDIKKAAEKYLHPDNAYIIVVGNKDEVVDKLKPFAANGKISYYDNYGRPVSDSKPIPAGVTPESVINKYIMAIGGLKAIKKVKDITTKMDGTVQGMDIQMTVQRKAPNKSLTSITAGVMVLQKQVFDGTRGFSSGMQGNNEITGEELEDLKLESNMFIETKYKELGYKLLLVSIEEVNGELAYKLEVTSPRGAKSYDYFSIASGFKLQSVKTKNVPQAGGEIAVTATFSDYKNAGGIKVPYTLSQSMGMQDLKWKVNAVLINQKLKDSDFK